MFLAPPIKPTPTPAKAPVIESIPASLTPGLSQENQRLLTELSDIAADINRLFNRACLKMMLIGMKEARTDNSAK
jgi:hypothetical protein